MANDQLDASRRNMSTIIRDAIAYRLTQVHTCIPAKVVSYDAATQLAECLPIVKNRVPLSDGSFFEETLPPVPDVPVAWPRGGSGFLHLPLAPGDLVTLVIAEQSYDQARTVNDVASPLTSRRHDLSDAIALPNSISASALPVNGQDVRLGNANGSVHIKPDGTLALAVTNSPAFHAAVAEKVAMELAKVQTVWSAMVTALALFNTAFGFVGGAPSVPAAAAGVAAAAGAVTLSGVVAGVSFADTSAPKVLLDG